MSVDRRKQAEELFQDALDLPIERRTVFLDERCGSDADLRNDVNALLETYDSDLGDFLEVSPLPPIEELVGDGADAGEPEAVHEPLPSVLSDHYRIVRELGHGGMGVVYLAHDTKLDRDVAIKMLPAAFSHDPKRLELFKREAKTAGSLNHPNIGTIYDFGEHEGNQFIVMEYVEGRQLDELLQGGVPLPLSEFLDFAIKIAQGLTAAHDNGVVHRDLKPGNIMVTDESRVKILDFGLAKAMRDGRTAPVDLSDSKLTPELTSALGTIGYSSPEQCLGEPADFRSDLFSFGVVLYQLITGRPPFRREGVLKTVRAVLEDQPESPNAGFADVPPQVTNLITKLLEKRPEDRYQTSAEVLADLEEIQRARQQTRWPLRVAVVVFVVAVALLVNSVFLGGSSMEHDIRPAELDRHIEAGNFVAARATFESLKRDRGPDDEELIGFERRLTARVDAWLTEQTGAVLARLLAGQYEDAQRLAKEIRLEDDDGSNIARVEQLLSDYDARRQETRDLDEVALAQLDSRDLEGAWRTIGEMREIRFESQTFREAHRRAGELKGQLWEALERKTLVLLDSEDESSIPGIETTIALLEEVDPANDYIRRLTLKKKTLGTDRRLNEIDAKARRDMTFAELEVVVREFDAIDSEADVTGHWRKIRSDRREQERALEDAFDEFRKRSPRGVRDELDRFQLARESLQTLWADQQLAQLQAAAWWLETFQAAFEDSDSDLDDVDTLREDLDRRGPSGRFRQTAIEHLDLLQEQVLSTAAHRNALSLLRKAGGLCSTLRLSEANETLRQLRRLEVGELQPEIDQLAGRIQGLEQEDEKWRRGDESYPMFLRELQRSPRDAAVRLEKLETYWEEEATRLSEALEVEVRDELLLRRADRYLRLGHFTRALKDAEQLSSTSGLRLRALARFAVAPEDPAAIRRALKDLADLSPKDGPWVLYLRGAFRHQLKDAGARDDLGQFIENQGSGSADAHFRLAAIRKTEAPSKAIEHLGKSLEAGMTEEEVIVAFGGNREAVNDIGLFRLETMNSLAIVQRQRGDWRECLKASNEVIKIDSSYYWAYLERAYAREELKMNGAREDYERFLSLGGKKVPNRVRADVLLRMEKLK